MNIQCFCGVPAHTAECHKGANAGKWFHGCGRYGTDAEPCKFFKWAKTEKKKRERSRSLTPPLPPTQIIQDEIEDDSPDQLRPKKRTITHKHARTLDRMIADTSSRLSEKRSEVNTFQHMLTDACDDLLYSERAPPTERRILQATEELIRKCLIDTTRDMRELEAQLFLLENRRKMQVE